MKQVALVFILIIVSSIGSFAKKKPDLALADTLLNQYPDDYLVSLNTKETYNFILNRSGLATAPLAISVDHSEEIISLTDFLNYQKTLFYNHFSKIDNINYGSLLYRNIGTIDQSLNSNDIFYSDSRIKKTYIYFESKGNKRSFNYSKTYFDFKYLTSIYFHDEYPIEKKTLEFVVPDWLKIELVEFNFEGYKITKDQKRNKIKEETTYIYTIEKIPSYPNEEYSPGPSHYLPHLLLICKSYTFKNNKYNLLNTIDDQYKWYRSLTSEIKNDPTVLQERVKELTAGKNDDIEKIKSIFYWVQDNIRYIAFEDGLAGFKPDPCQNVYNNRYGDCKGMANLTKEMLILAGFDARLTWIGTNHIAYDYSIPSLAVDNHMICTVILNGKKYYLDATETFISFDDYAERIQGKEALIEDGDNYIKENVPEFKSERNQTIATKNVSIDKGILKGNAEFKYNGESKTLFLRGYASLKQDQQEDALWYYLTHGDKNLDISNISTSNLTNRDTVLTISYDLELKNKVRKFGNELYVNLDFDKEYEFEDFEDDRESDYLFYYKINSTSTVELTIPKNYIVKNLPETLNITSDDYIFQINFENKEDKIIYTKKIIIENGMVKQKDLDKWNEFIKDFKEISDSYIVLEKTL